MNKSKIRIFVDDSGITLRYWGPHFISLKELKNHVDYKHNKIIEV